MYNERFVRAKEAEKFQEKKVLHGEEKQFFLCYKSSIGSSKYSLVCVYIYTLGHKSVEILRFVKENGDFSICL